MRKQEVGRMASMTLSKVNVKSKLLHELTGPCERAGDPHR